GRHAPRHGGGGSGREPPVRRGGSHRSGHAVAARRRPMTEPVTIIAPAKLTLTLRVTGVRGDGYHLIDAEMVSLDIADELTFRDTGRTTIVLTGPTAPGLSAGDDNLVARALRA